MFGEHRRALSPFNDGIAQHQRGETSSPEFCSILRYLLRFYPPVINNNTITLMAITTCKYHPKVPARWECHDCEVAFCSDCVNTDLGKNRADCPLCKKPATQVTASNFIVPFWNRIPKFFLYPANLTSLIFIVLIVAISLASQYNLLGIIIQLLLLLMFLKYSMAVLLHTSQGHLKPPNVSIEMISDNIVLPIKLIILFVIIFFSISLLYEYAGSTAAIIWAIFLFASLPASIMLLAIDNALYRAINPLLLFNVMRKIGAPYLVLYIFLLLVLGGNGVIASVLIESDNALLLFINNVLGYYFIIIIFNMMGYLIFQYHDELGYAIEIHVGSNLESQKKKSHIAVNPILNEADVLIKEGRLDDAVKVIEEKLHQDSKNLGLHARYHELLKHTQNQDKLGTHGQDYMNILLFNKQTGKAANVYRECLKANPNLQPSDPDKIYLMAQTLHDLHAFREAVTLINGFHRNFRKHPDIAQNYLFAAKMLNGELQQPKQALSIIQFLQSKYQDDPLFPEINQYAEYLTSNIHTK